MPPIVSAHPSIFVNGQARPGLTADLIELNVEERTNAPACCRLHVSNWGTVAGSTGYRYFDRTVLDFGHEISVRVGPASAPEVLFHGRINGIEAAYPSGRPPEVVAIAEDRLQDLRLTRRSRCFEEVTDLDACRMVAADHGLSLYTNLTDGTKHSVLAQFEVERPGMGQGG